MGISVVGGSTGSASKTLKVARFTTPGLSTFTLPNGYDGSNPLVAEVTIVGGGGASGTGTIDYLNSGNYKVAPGAGGGGAVWKGTVELTQNMNVHVGRGGLTNNHAANGYYPWGGGNGGTSYISTGTPKNWFLNPQFLGGGNQRDLQVIPMPFSNHENQTQSQPKHSGIVTYWDSNRNGSRFHSTPLTVLPSTNYCWSVYAYDSSGTITCDLQLHWYQADGTFISTSTRNNSIYSTSGASANQIYVGAASPSNAAYVILGFYTGYGSRSLYFSNVRLETGSTTPTTYVDGNTSGYFYAGPAAGAITFSESDTTYFAAGGGGGYAPRSNLSNTFFGSTPYGLHGFAGGCSGGGAFFSGNTLGSASYTAVGGHGGGAGGNAVSITRDSGNGDWGSSYATPGLNSNCTQGAGSRGKGFYDASVLGGAGYADISELGTGGLPLDGFGKGGTTRAYIGGSWYNNNIPYFGYIESTTDAASAYIELSRIMKGKDNTGDGADTAMFYSSSQFYAPGFTGGSGLVIIKYWE